MQQPATAQAHAAPSSGMECMDSTDTNESTMPAVDRIASLTETDLFCLDMLGKGYDAKAVANAAGVPVDGVRSLADEFMPAIVQKRVEAHTVELSMQDRAFRIEDTALQRLENCLIMETDPIKLLKIYNTMRGNNDKTRMERRGQNPHGATIINATVVSLSVPDALTQRQEFRESITIDSASRVVAIGSKAIASASKSHIDALLLAKEQRSELTVEDFHDGT